MQKYISQNEVDNAVNKMANGTKTAKSIEKKNQKPGEKENAIDEEKKTDEEWFSSNAPIEWVMMAPKLSDEDLRPYFFACKETEDYFFDKTAEDKIREIITVLLASEMAIVGKKDDIAKLSTEEAMKVFDLLSDRITIQDTWNNMPNGIVGLRILVELHPDLRAKMMKFIKRVDTSKAGLWFASGWNKCIPYTCEEYTELEKYMASLAKKEGVNRALAAGLKKVERGTK